MKGFITLLTDFGLKDGYVGAMKGVILSINPEVHIVDITHDVGSQCIFEAAFILYTTYSYFPRGSVHLVVVDPGVGTERRPIGISTKEYLFVGPDNGVFSFIFRNNRDAVMFELVNETYFGKMVSQTFHGRDIFAPVAAHLSLGIPLSEIGKEIRGCHTIQLPQPRVSEGILEGQVIHKDRFGNLITNVSYETFSNFVDNSPFMIKLGLFGTHVVRSAYAEAMPGELLAIFGSTGYLEISESMGDASVRLGMGVGGSVTIKKV